MIFFSAMSSQLYRLFENDSDETRRIQLFQLADQREAVPLTQLQITDHQRIGIFAKIGDRLLLAVTYRSDRKSIHLLRDHLLIDLYHGFGRFHQQHIQHPITLSKVSSQLYTQPSPVVNTSTVFEKTRVRRPQLSDFLLCRLSFCDMLLVQQTIPEGGNDHELCDCDRHRGNQHTRGAHQ